MLWSGSDKVGSRPRRAAIRPLVTEGGLHRVGYTKELSHQRAFLGGASTSSCLGLSKSVHQTQILKHSVRGEAPAIDGSSIADEGVRAKRQAANLHRKTDQSFDALLLSFLESSAEKKEAPTHPSDVRQLEYCIIETAERSSEGCLTLQKTLMYQLQAETAQTVVLRPARALCGC